MVFLLLLYGIRKITHRRSLKKQFLVINVFVVPLHFLTSFVYISLLSDSTQLVNKKGVKIHALPKATFNGFFGFDILKFILSVCGF